MMTVPQTAPQWEYCRVMYSEGYEVRRQEIVTSCTCTVSYFNDDDPPFRVELVSSDLWPGFSWYRAYSRLGCAGWELVSVHQEIDQTKSAASGDAHPEWGSPEFYPVIAFFKRQKIDGRKVDEPGSLNGSTRDDAMLRWEYLSVFVREDNWRDNMGRSGNFNEIKVGRGLGQMPFHDNGPLLNQLGNEGWELTGTVAGGLVVYALLFKRPKSN